MPTTCEQGFGIASRRGASSEDKRRIALRPPVELPRMDSDSSVAGASRRMTFLSKTMRKLSRIPTTLGIVFILLSIVASCGGGSEQPTGVTPPAVASVVVAPDSSLMIPGGSAQLAVTLRDSKGAALTGHTITWSSSDNSKVSVTQTGQITAVAVGRVVVTATSEGKSGSTVIVVAASLGRDFTIIGAQFTQGVQDAAGSIPIVRSGMPAVVNVLMQATPPSTTPMEIVLRLYDAQGNLAYSDTVVPRLPLTSSASYLSPTVQFLVPSARLAAGLTWQVVRDPRGVVADDARSNDVFPRTGAQALVTATVPPLNIRFVPIVLASNGNSTPSVTDAGLTDYLRTLRSIHPLGVVNAHVGAAFTTSSNFGTAPRGGEQTFWTDLLAELDLARLADPTESTINWYGVVAPPAGFNFTSFGGFSYIPASGTSTGARTRTSLGVRTGWFSAATQARDLVAHELAHTFGRQHAPCAAAGNPDVNYPVAGGVLDVAGHDVYAWANGLATTAATVSPSTGDVMGYCFPVWASTYTYKAILQFRQPQVIAARSNAVESNRTRVIIVRGRIDNEQTIKLEPSFSLTARPTEPEPGDTYRAEGLDASGRVLFTTSFEPAVVDHAPKVRHFAVAVPLSAGAEDNLAEVRVIGRAGTATLKRAAEAIAKSRDTRARITVARRAPGGSIEISCPADSTRGILVIDEASGTVLGTAARENVRPVAAPGARLSVLCSDAVRTTRASIVAPN